MSGSTGEEEYRY